MTLLTACPDAGGLVALAAVTGYLVCAARSRYRVGSAARAAVVAAGLLWLVVTAGPVGALAATDLRARAVAIVVLLYVVPLGLAAGRPVRVLRGLRAGEGGPRSRRSGRRLARVALHPGTTSVALLLTPWLLLLSPWLPATDQHRAVGTATGLLLVAIGFAYFHARLQVDPVPRRYPAALSLIISVVESIADGVLGLVLWIGPLLATSLAQFPDPAAAREAQTVAAGILWIGGDVAGLPFLVALLVRLRSEDTRRSAQIDAELDRAHGDPVAHDGDAPEAVGGDGGGDVRDPRGHAATVRPWWEDDPQLAERFRRR